MQTEIWKDVLGWEDYYQVSNFGNVKSKIRTGKTSFGERSYGGDILKKINHKNGYDVVNLAIKGKRQQKLVHTLVLESFVSARPDKMDSCHNNGNRKDNRLENLRWDTRKNNHADKLLHGTWSGGENNGFAKLTINQAKEAKYSSFSLKFLSNKFNVSVSCLSKIRYGLTWKHI